MDNHDAEAMGGSEIIGDGRDGPSPDRGREGDDLEILYGRLGYVDRGLIILLLFLIAWPSSFVRLAFVVMIGAMEAHVKGAEISIREFKIKAWERRVVSLFTVIMIMSKLIWWTLLCSIFVLGLRVGWSRVHNTSSG